jgi:pyridoxal 5'-phosphate synthase pdxS subunit
MALGAQAVFVGSGIFMSNEPLKRAKAVVQATTYWQDAKKLVEISTGIGEAMKGIEMEKLSDDQRLAKRGW